jgi:pilus assembly protein FimV
MHNKTAMISGKLIDGSGTGHRQRSKTALAASAVALALLGISVDAQAVALGAAAVRSALGEKLRAEIEVPQISSEEAASFQAIVASPQAFRAAGLEYTPALAGARITLHRRANGQAYLRLVSNHPVNEPFLSVVIEASWANGGSMVRDYTMLVDPPARPAPAPVAVTPSAVEAAPQAPANDVVRLGARPPSGDGARTPAPAPAGSGDGAQVTVQRGNTALGIVSAHPIEGVSLDQMLVALLRANPKAFIRGNVNLVRAGAVLNMPTVEQANAVSRQAARRAVVAQTRDFNAYRHGIAMNAPNAGSGPAGSGTSGRVQPQVRENHATATSPDRLVLPRTDSASVGAEKMAANSRHAREQAEREEELKRNIADIELIKQSSSAPESTASPAGINVPTGAPAPSAPVEAASNPVAAASEPAPEPKPEPRPAPPLPLPPAPESEPGFFDGSMPYVLGAAALVLLLGGLVFSRLRRGKKEDTSLLDSSFAESRLQPDSFFGTGGGQRVNTREDTGSGGSTSLAYSPSQLDAVGDVDPVAEADVYLAYGRDAQAEEILKEALHAYPGRISIHRKLAEIYAKRRDSRALQGIASEAHDVTHGQGTDWDAIAALGSELDPENPLYKSGGAPAPKPAPVPASGNSAPDSGGPPTVPLPNNLDSVGDSRRHTGFPPTMDMKADPASARSAAGPATVPVDLDLDLDLDQGLDFAPPSQLAPEPLPPAAPAPAAAPSADSGSPGMIELDMDALSIDPDSRSGNELHTAQPDDADDDPLATKLALAQEFHGIGDTEGARSLVKEVIAEASGALKARAERFLAELG